MKYSTTSLPQPMVSVNTQTSAIAKIRAHAVPVRSARIVDHRTLLIFDPAMVVWVSDPNKLPRWAKQPNGCADFRALARRSLRSGAVLLDRETLDPVRGVALYTIHEWVSERLPERSAL